jgi:hypothetical protein
MNGYGVMMFAGHVRKWRDSLIFFDGVSIFKVMVITECFFQGATMSAENRC